ncbi:hypothetical protein ACSR9E_05680 [Citrobacter koseri]|uniref:hypothetical protein n=1 Tax=Citrobacter koseri TaxID=545 RepID=UPI0040422CF3
MLNLKEFITTVADKIKCLTSEVLETEWCDCVEVFDENNSHMISVLKQKREEFWNSKKIGTMVRCYTDECIGDDEFETINGQLRRKDKYTELYDPVRACWKALKNEISLRTMPHWFKRQSLDDIFFSHAYCGSLAYQWAVSVASENENVALESLILASQMLDKCTGMIWVKIYWEKEKELSRKRTRAGSKGGKAKAEFDVLIQKKLAKMLRKEGSKSGWKSKTAAVDEIIESLWKYVQESAFIVNDTSKKHRVATMDQEALRNTILKQWSTEVDVVREAFDATVTRQKRKTVVKKA